MSETKEPEKEKKHCGIKSALKHLVMWFYSELLWLLRRSPVVLLTVLTWYALEVSKDISTPVMVACAFGYFAVHHYLKWIEAKYEATKS